MWILSRENNKERSEGCVIFTQPMERTRIDEYQFLTLLSDENQEEDNRPPDRDKGSYRRIRLETTALIDYGHIINPWNLS